MEPTTIPPSIDPRGGVGGIVFDSRTRGPVMLDALKIGAVLNRSVLTVVVLALSLGLTMPAPSLGRQTSANDWVGNAVVPKARNFTLKDARTGSPVSGPKATVYHV